MQPAQEQVTVQMSTPALRPSSNPYATMLVQALQRTPGVHAQVFTWRNALMGRYDVFHMHWPEAHLRGSSPLRTGRRLACFGLLLARLRVTNTPLVRTVHNIELPSDISRVERALLLATQRNTTLRIRLNAETPIPRNEPHETIVHGDYRDWFVDFERAPVCPGRIAFVGSVRRYKAVPELAAAFADTNDPGLTLRISGRASSAELEQALAAITDPRITLDLRTITDAELVSEVTAAELVVLPYPEMHNSGATLAVLSLARPVLVPDNPVNRDLATEVGSDWVLTYPGPLTAQILEHAMMTVRSKPAPGVPDLSRRNWTDGAVAHREAYRRAMRITAAHGLRARVGAALRRAAGRAQSVAESRSSAQ